MPSVAALLLGFNHKLDRILTAVERVEGKLMAGAQEFRDLLAAMNASLDGITADIQALVDAVGQPGDGGLDAAETDEIRALVATLASRMATLDAQRPAPPTP